jgi:hypothetical protein
MQGTMGSYDLRTSMGLSTLLPHSFEMNTLPRPIPNGYFQQVVHMAFSRADRMVYASKKAGGHCFNFDDACDWPDPHDWAASADSSLCSTLLSREDQ